MPNKIIAFVFSLVVLTTACTKTISDQSNTISFNNVRRWKVLASSQENKTSTLKIKSRKNGSSATVKIIDNDIPVNEILVKVTATRLEKDGAVLLGQKKSQIAGKDAECIFCKKTSPSDPAKDVYLAVYLFKHNNRVINITTGSLQPNIETDEVLASLLASITLNS